MNGDNYSSRDGGRHGSSRDYPSARREREEGRERDRDRRRSRSPEYRSSRPRRDGDTDVYSSSRSHRDREREDRYSGRRDRERDWDRGDRGDRGDRRRERREEDDRGHSRRDRDPHDDRRGSRRDRDRDHDTYDGARNRRRSPSPPPKKREPTPDLTNVVSVLERKRRMTQWDIKPPGYQNVTAEQAKLSGMFPLPGAPRQQPMDPSKLQAFMNNPGASAANSAALKPTNSRQAKRLLISNFPPSATEDQIISFFNLQLNGLNVIESTDPCLLCQISRDFSFALLEFKSSSDATVALALDGISMEPEDGSAGGASSYGLIIKRPKDYIVPAVVEDTPYEPGKVSNIVVDTPNKLSIANIPTFLTDDQAMELLVTFGQLKAFVLVRDRDTQESRGIAFCEFVDPSNTEAAVTGLDGLAVAENNLRVRKASIGITQVAGVESGVNAINMLAGTTATDSEESRVLQLLNMVTAEELMDNDDYEEICEDVRDECSKFGTIIDLKIPRPTGGSRQSAGVGKIFVKYEKPEFASKALKALAGRKFADRTVVTTYFPEENFDVGAW